VGEGAVFPFGVEDPGQAREDRLAVDVGLDEAAFALADLAADEHVGVGQPGAVELPGVIDEGATVGVGADVHAAAAEAALGHERVGGLQVAGGGSVPGPLGAVQDAHARPAGEREREGEGVGLLAEERAEFDVGLLGGVLDFGAGALEAVLVGGRDGDEAGQAQFGVAVDELPLRAGGSSGLAAGAVPSG